MQIRRQSTHELQIFKDRWERAVEEDQNWVDPFEASSLRRRQRRKQIRKLKIKLKDYV